MFSGIALTTVASTVEKHVVTSLVPVDIPVSPTLSCHSNTNISWNVADLLLVEEELAPAWQTEDEPERSLLDQGSYMKKFLLPKTSNPSSSPRKCSTLPPKPSHITMGPVTNHQLLLKPSPLSSTCLNTRKKNVWTNQLFIKMTLHLPDNLLMTCILTKLRQTSLSIAKCFLKLETPTQFYTKTKACLLLISSPLFLTLCFPFIVFDFCYIVWYHELVVHGCKKGIMLWFLYLIPCLVIVSLDIYAFGLYYAFGLLTDYAILHHL